MTEILDLIQKLQGLGIGGVALLFLWLTNRYHVTQREAEVAAARDREKTQRVDYQQVIDKKDAVIAVLSDQLRDAATQARVDMERHLTRQMEEVQRLEAIIQQNTAAVGGLQKAVGEVHDDLRDRRPRGGGA